MLQHVTDSFAYKDIYIFSLMRKVDVTCGNMSKNIMDNTVTCGVRWEKYEITFCFLFCFSENAVLCSIDIRGPTCYVTCNTSFKIV